MRQQVFTLKAELGAKKYVHGVVPMIPVMVVLVGHQPFIIITLYKCHPFESSSNTLDQTNFIKAMNTAVSDQLIFIAFKSH